MAFHRPKETLYVNASDILSACEVAQMWSSDRQAELCEIILSVPGVMDHWREMNNRQIELRRHEGIPHINHQPDDNRAVGEAKQWHLYAGYVFYLDGRANYSYNGVHEDWYSHSPSCAWDGIRRETYSGWLENMRALAYSWAGEFKLYEERVIEDLTDHNVVVVNDL